MPEKIQGSRSRSIHYSNTASEKNRKFQPLPSARKRFSNAEQINSRQEKMRMKLLKKIADRKQQPLVIQPELELVAIAIFKQITGFYASI